MPLAKWPKLKSGRNGRRVVKVADPERVSRSTPATGRAAFATVVQQPVFYVSRFRLRSIGTKFTAIGTAEASSLARAKLSMARVNAAGTRFPEPLRARCKLQDVQQLPSAACVGRHLGECGRCFRREDIVELVHLHLARQAVALDTYRPVSLQGVLDFAVSVDCWFGRSLLIMAADQRRRNRKARETRHKRLQLFLD